MKVFLVCSFLFLIFSCSNHKNDKIKKDYFNTDNGGFDRRRMPLVKPYEAIKVSDTEWRTELQTTQLLELSIHNIQALNVIDSVVIIYAKGAEVSIRDVKYKEAWFVIIPNKQIEKGFDKKEDFIKYLATVNIKEAKLYNADKIYKTFYKNKKIYWQGDFK